MQRPSARLYLGKVAEKHRFVLCIHLGVLAEPGVALEGHVGGQHHQLSTLNVGILKLSTPLSGHPVELHQVFEIRVVKLEGVVRPRAVKPRPHLVAAAERVTTRESDNLPVPKAHPPKHRAKMVRPLGKGMGESVCQFVSE